VCLGTGAACVIERKRVREMGFGFYFSSSRPVHGTCSSKHTRQCPPPPHPTHLPQPLQGASDKTSAQLKGVISMLGLLAPSHIPLLLGQLQVSVLGLAESAAEGLQVGEGVGGWVGGCG
jgi:hypothetical protein